MTYYPLDTKVIPKHVLQLREIAIAMKKINTSSNLGTK